jgi:type II secretory pathway pseudopilin PulG
MKFFSKSELISVIIIFAVLVVVSWPNFTLSMRRARDQIRRDDIGNIQAAIDEYYADYGVFPASTSDGRMVVCKGSGQDQVPCNWGRDTWINLTPGVNKVYMKFFPGDPKLSDGTSYYYSSDGSRYQLFGSLEGTDEPEYDPKLAARGVKCGNKICNIGRANNVPLYITVEEYGLQIFCSQHPKETKCINRQINK